MWIIYIWLFILSIAILIILNRQVQHLRGSRPQTSGCLLHKLWRVTLCCANKGTDFTNPSLSLILRRRCWLDSQNLTKLSQCRDNYSRVLWYYVISRMVKFSPLERDATVSSVTTPLLMKWDPDWSPVWTNPPHRSHVAGKNLEGDNVNAETVVSFN